MEKDILLLAILAMLVEQSISICSDGPPTGLPNYSKPCWFWDSGTSTYRAGDAPPYSDGSYDLTMTNGSTSEDCSFRFTLYNDSFDINLICGQYIPSHIFFKFATAGKGIFTA